MTASPWTTCSRCGADRTGQERYCPRCGLDYWTVTPGQQPTSSALQETVRTDTAVVVITLLSLAGMAAGGLGWLWLMFEPAGDNLLTWFGGALVAAVVGHYLGRWAAVALLTR